VRALLVIVLIAGCKKGAEKEPERPPAIPPAEVERARLACDDYVAKACACADSTKNAEVVKLCELGKALPDALRVSLEVANNPTSSKNDVTTTQNQARLVAKSCVEGVAKLPTFGCPQ
jgi:hypothetical protein